MPDTDEEDYGDDGDNYDTDKPVDDNKDAQAKVRGVLMIY
jgi:hypothetical protein